MSEQLYIAENLSKAEQYKALFPQLLSLTEEETDVIANMANIAAALKEVFNFWWVGFYLVKENELVLGPFQGPIACTRIALGRGVCGTAWKEEKTIVVPDVTQFHGHIACSSHSKSEIVVPLLRNGLVWAIFDIDSEHLNTFNETDVFWLEKIGNLL